MTAKNAVVVTFDDGEELAHINGVVTSSHPDGAVEVDLYGRLRCDISRDIYKFPSRTAGDDSPPRIGEVVWLSEMYTSAGCWKLEGFIDELHRDGTVTVKITSSVRIYAIDYREQDELPPFSQ